MFKELIKRMKEFRYDTKRLFKMMKDSEGSTYFPEEERKSKWSMWRDNLAWFGKHGETNFFYYVYGLDRKNSSNESELLSWKEFKNTRNKRNQQLAGKKYNYVCLLQDKFVFGQFLASLGFPTPNNIAIFDKKEITWLNNMKTEPLDTLITNPSINVNGFCKKLSGILGEGAFTLRIIEGKFYTNDSEIKFDQLKGKIDGQYLFQERITQHPKMSELHPASVNTIRLVTFNNSGKVDVFSTVLRIGAKGKSVDNWASGGIIVSIDKQTGKLVKEGMFKIGYGGRVTTHPDTGVLLENFQIPFFQECIQMACKLHSYFYGVHSVGWDIAITANGPLFIEGNDDWDGAIPMALEKNFKSRFLQMFPKNSSMSE